MKSLNLILIIVSGSIMISRLIKYYPYSNWSLLIIFIFGFLLIFFSVLFFLKNELSKKILISFISILITIYFINPFLYFITERNDISKLRYKEAKKQNVFYDKRTRLDVIQDFKKQNQEAFPVIPPAGFYKRFKGKYNFLPLGGVSNVLTVHCNESGSWTSYMSDEYGFNNKKISFNSDSEKKVLIVGDSFAQGACVSQDESVSGQLTKKGIETKTLGMDGNGPLAALASIKEYSKEIKPNIIIWLVFDNDLGDLKRELKNPILKNYLDTSYSQNLIIRKKEINDILIKEISKKYSQNENKIKNFLNKSVSLFYIRKLIGLTKNNLEKKEIKNKNKLFDELEKTIFLMKNLSENLNANFKIVYIPDILKFKNKEYANLRPSYLFDIKDFEEILKNTNVAWLNFYQIMLDSKDPLSFYPFKLKGHFTPQGYKTLAKEIQKFLQ